MDTNKKVIFVIVGILFVLTLIMLLFYNDNDELENSNNNNNNNNNNSNGNNLEDNEDIILKKEYTNDYSIYFTLQNILHNYHYNVSNKNISNLVDVLDDSFINDNALDYSNIDNYIDFHDTYYNVKIDGLKEIKLKNNLTIYYVSTVLMEEAFDYAYGTNKTLNTYEVIILDNNKNTYSVIPITEYDYNEDSVNEKELSSIESIENNEINEFSISTVLNRSLATMYYYDFQEIMLYKENEKEEVLESVPNSYEMLQETAIESYEINLENNKIIIYDENDYKLIFDIENILNYTVDIYNK